MTILLLVTVINGCSSYDPRYDSLYNQVETNRENIVNLAEAMQEALNLTQNQFDANREYIQQTRAAIIQMGNIVNQQSEYLNQQSSDLNKLKLLLQVLAAL